MKKIISLFLVIGVMLSVFAVTAVAQETPVKEFVIDGKLDEWYLTEDEAREYYPDDLNTYHITWFDPYVKGGAGTGSAPFDEPVTKAELFTAYDDTYVYFYIKVWDDELRFWNDFEPDDYVMTTDSSTGDSIDIWFDPDPDSVNKFNFNDPTMDPTDNGKKFYFCNNTRDARQGDVQCRVQGALNPADNTVKIDDYHDYTKDPREPIYRPGYNNQLFGEYIHNVDNVCHFTFENEPVIIDEWSGKEVSSGYGVELRFPRNDDETNSYYYNIAVNNSSIYRDERYSLALGAAWWTSYTSGQTVHFEEVNPFFNQPIDVDPDQGGQDTPPEPPVPPAPEVKLGDINSDDVINAKDALLALRIAVSKYEATEEELIAADVNKDEVINAKDALEMLKFAVGKPSCIPAE